MNASTNAKDAIVEGRARLGIELGSTRIKACLIGDDPSQSLAVGSHEWENQLVEGLWTYSLEDVWTGLQAAVSDLQENLKNTYGVVLENPQAIGISAMMHGYLAFDENDELLVPFRTWRNTNTGEAAAELSELFGVNIPLRWSVAHVHQAIKNGEEHVSRIRSLNTLAGYVHWKLTGKRVLGVGDASGMFPIDSSTINYDAHLVARYDELVHDTALATPLSVLLPEVLAAGAHAGELTAEGAALLDPSGVVKPGALFCPPEGDAGTGMVATNAVAPRTGNVSAGTSIFAMVVLEKPLSEVHDELDLVTTPVGDPVAMVHCNNGASELAAWVGMFSRFAEAAGMSLDADQVYDVVFREALEGAADAGGLLSYNFLAGEPVAKVDHGRPVFVRTPDSQFTLANAMRSQLYSVFGALSVGMEVLHQEGVELERMSAHGGMFRTAGVAQRFLSAALNAPVSVAQSASEGGAWGVAVLAAFAASDTDSLADYLTAEVFSRGEETTVTPVAEDVEGFAQYLERFQNGLDVVRTAGEVL
jgi:sugar (pentulose or hexulose) kinase